MTGSMFARLVTRSISAADAGPAKGAGLDINSEHWQKRAEEMRLFANEVRGRRGEVDLVPPHGRP